MTSDLFVSEVGLISVPSNRNSEIAQKAMTKPTANQGNAQPNDAEVNESAPGVHPAQRACGN
jgi:hypothetical protein